MIRVVKAKAEHLFQLKEMGSVKYLEDFMTPESCKALEAAPYSFTGFNEEGEILGSFGLNHLWKDRAEAWAFFNLNCKKDFLSIHNGVRRFLDICPYRRVEAIVDYDFQAAHRWVKSLGFTLEAERMKHYIIDGRDASLYARINPWKS